jgi:hypothetical protein
MSIKRAILSLLTALVLASTCWAQSGGRILYNGLPVVMQTVQTKAQTTQMAYNWAQQTGNLAEMQRCQAEARLHEQMYNALTRLMNNPQKLEDPRIQQEYMNSVHEYNYRTDMRDLRPYDQIQGALAQYIAEVRWRAETPEGQAAHQATIQTMQANTQAMTQAHNQRMNDLQAQAAARNQAWVNSQNQQEINHQRFIHGIYNQYQYINPNTGQGYWVPMENQYPAVVNPNGTYTPLIPYQSY